MLDLESFINEKNQFTTPYISGGDFTSIDNVETVINQELHNGLIENEKIIMEANEDARFLIIENIFRNYPFVTNFKVLKFDNIETYDFKFNIEIT